MYISTEFSFFFTRKPKIFGNLDQETRKNQKKNFYFFLKFQGASNMFGAVLILKGASNPGGFYYGGGGVVIFGIY